MLVHKKISKRLNESTKFFQNSDEFQSMRDEFSSTGKIVSTSRTVSEDKLTKTVITEFKDEEAFLEYINHPATKTNKQLRIKYEKENNISSTFDFDFID